MPDGHTHTKKTRMMGLVDYQAEKKFDDTFSRFDTMYDCDRQTDRQTPVHG